MNIKSLRSDKIYRKVLRAPQEEKVEIFRQEMLAPFMKKNGKYNKFLLELRSQTVLMLLR